MRTPLPLLLLSFSLAGATCLASSPAPQPAPAAEAPQPQDALLPDPLMLCGQLENGLRYIIRPTREPAGQAALRLIVETGALDESPETSGISHFIEHMVFNGSRHFRRGELIPAMQNLGLGFGGDANAYTGMEHTIYKLNLPNLRPETVNFAFTILRDFADGATLADEDIERERGIIVSELHERDSAATRTDLATMRCLLGGSRVVDYQPIGREDVIRNCPAETIRRFYQEHYVPSRMTLIIAGDIRPEQATEWVREAFGSMQARTTPQRPPVGSPTETGPASFVLPDAEAGNCTLVLSTVKPWQPRTDSPAQRMADLPLELATTMLNRRLARLARGADCPFISAILIPRENACGAAELFSLSITCRPEQWQAALCAAENELRRAVEHGFSATELSETASAVGASHRKAVETWERISANALTGRLINALRKGSVFTSPAEEARLFAEGLRPLLDKPELCRAALAAAYEPERLRLIMSGKVAEDASPEALSAALATARQQAVSTPAEEALRPFAYEHIGEPGQIVDRQQLEGLGITTLRFANGVRVNLKPIGPGMGRIFVSAAVDGGCMKMPPVPALAEMLQAVMTRGGLAAHSAEELSRLLAGHNVGCNFSMDEERFLFSGSTTPQDLELQCKLLCAAILHPGYRPNGEAQLRRSLPAFFRSMQTTPEKALGEQATRDIFGDDPRFCIPRPEHFAAVNTESARQAIAPFLEQGALELTLVGDFAVEAVLPILARSFGAMPPRAAEFRPLPEGARRVDFRPWGNTQSIPCDTGLDKTLIAHLRPAGNGRDARRNLRLNVLRNIVGGRLFSLIRAELGEGYAPSVQTDLRPGYDNAATLVAMSTGVAANRETVLAAMEQVFASLAEGNISEYEFRQVMPPYMAETQMAYRRPAFWVNHMLRLQSEPEAAGLLRDMYAEVSGITLEEIRQLARDIFGPGKPGNYYITTPAKKD